MVVDFSFEHEGFFYVVPEELLRCRFCLLAQVAVGRQEAYVLHLQFSVSLFGYKNRLILAQGGLVAVALMVFFVLLLLLG